MLLLATSVAVSGELKLVGKSGITNVNFVTTNKTVRLTNFRNRHHIYKASLSPSERFAFIWHMDFAPRKVMVVDVTTQHVLAEFSPLLAGDLEWSADDRLIHIFGFGTGRYATTYSNLGRELFSTGPSFELFEKCDIVLDPSRRALVLLPNLSTAPGRIMLVRTLDAAVHKLGPERVACSNWSWHEGALRISYTTNANEDALLQSLEIPLPHQWLAHKEP